MLEDFSNNQHQKIIVGLNVSRQYLSQIKDSFLGAQLFPSKSK